MFFCLLQEEEEPEEPREKVGTSVIVWMFVESEVKQILTTRLVF